MRKKVQCVVRHIGWTDSGITIEADTEHVDHLFRDLDTPVPAHPRDVPSENVWMWTRPRFTAEVQPGLPTSAMCLLATSVANWTTVDMFWLRIGGMTFLRGKGRAKISFARSDQRTRRSLSGGLLADARHAFIVTLDARSASYCLKFL